MNTLGLYLWKEWREHRRAVLAVALICTVMMTGFAWQLATRQVLADPLFPSVAGMAAVLIALLAVGGELLGERRAGGLAWLQRMPAGLATPFWMKLTFHVVVTIAAGAFGIVLAFVAAWLRGAPQEGLHARHTYPVLFLVALLAVWTFAASAWTSRSVLALFGAGFTIAGLGMPIWYLTNRGYQPRQWEIEAGGVLLLLGALPSAWLGFVTAGRFGRSQGFAVLLGFSSAVASFLPFWVWGAWQIHLRDRFDPSGEGFEICSAVVTGDERTAFVEAWMWNERWDAEALPRSILRVSLEDGVSELIRRGDVAMIPARMCTQDCGKADNLHVFDRRSSSVGEGFYLDTGAPMGMKDVVLPPFRCPERRGWLVARAPFRADSALTDGFTGKTLHPADLSLPRDSSLWSDLALWYVISRSQGAFLLDPDSKRLERAAWLDSVGDSFGPRLPDGRFFAPLKAGGIGLVDPHRTRVTAVLEGKRVERVHRSCGYGNSPFEEGEVVLLRTSEGEYRFDRALEKLEAIPFLRDSRRPRPVGTARDGAVFANVGNGLVRYDIDSGEQTWLFPPMD